MSNRQHAGPSPADSSVPEPTLAERARTLVSLAAMGSLATHSRRLPGFPFASLMPFAADDRGRPVFFVSTMAMHTQNLQQDNRSSLLLAQPDTAGDPLGAARLTLTGRAQIAPASEVRDLYLARHENARFWQDYTDFAYWRLEIEGVYFIGGFGVMGWIAPEEYAAALPDPLAEAAPELIREMNAHHPQALRRLAGENPDDARVTAIDRLGFHLRLRTGDRVHSRRIAFLREVKNPGEARTVFAEMVRPSP